MTNGSMQTFLMKAKIIQGQLYGLTFPTNGSMQTFLMKANVHECHVDILRSLSNLLHFSDHFSDKSSYFYGFFSI